METMTRQDRERESSEGTKNGSDQKTENNKYFRCKQNHLINLTKRNFQISKHSIQMTSKPNIFQMIKVFKPNISTSWPLDCLLNLEETAKQKNKVGQFRAFDSIRVAILASLLSPLSIITIMQFRPFSMYDVDPLTPKCHKIDDMTAAYF